MTEGALPLFFHPPRVYVLKDVWACPDAARRAERLCQAFPGAEVRTFTYEEFPAIAVQEGRTKRVRMGRREHVPPPLPVLSLFRFDREAVGRDAARLRQASPKGVEFPYHFLAGGHAFNFFCSMLNEVKPNPDHICRPQWRIYQGWGCPHQCGYCSLGDWLLVNLNVEEYIARLADLMRENPWQKTYLIDDSMDVLTLEPQLDWMGPLMRFFQSTGDRYLIIHTKSDRVEALLQAGAPRNTIVTWSLSGATQARELEPLTPDTVQRIEAARRCQEAGLTIRYKFKPIVPVPKWREEAAEMLELALSRTRPDNLSMTVLMWMQAEDLKSCIAAAHLDPAFLRAAEAAAEKMRGSRNAPFPHEVRELVYRHYLGETRKRDREVPLTLSTESLEMWKVLGPELGFRPSDYVCGCGAGSTPGRKRLDSNPWEDARQARTWDGQAAEAGKG